MTEPAIPPVSVRHYQALAGAALVAIFLVQVQQNLSMVVNALVLVLGVVGILFRVRLSPLFVLAAIVLGQVADQYQQNQFFNPDLRSFRFLDASDLLLCLATPIYFVAQYRLHGLWFNVLPFDPRQQPMGPPPIDGSVPTTLPQARSESTLTPSELAWLVIPIPGFVLLAEFFTLLLKQHWDLVGFPPRWRQFFAIAWLLILVVFFAAHGFRYWRRLQMDHATAQLLLQDVLWHETRGEQRRIQRWIAWRGVKKREET